MHNPGDDHFLEVRRRDLVRHPNFTRCMTDYATFQYTMQNAESDACVCVSLAASWNVVFFVHLLHDALHGLPAAFVLQVQRDGGTAWTSSLVAQTRL